jgi:hypothetical protein
MLAHSPACGASASLCANAVEIHAQTLKALPTTSAAINPADRSFLFPMAKRANASAISEKPAAAWPLGKQHPTSAAGTNQLLAKSA